MSLKMKRKVDWFRVGCILTLASVLIWAAFAGPRSPLRYVFGASNEYPLEVELPQPGYLKADGTLLHPTSFRHTKIMYGQCDPSTDIGVLYGEVTVSSSSFKSPVFYAPVNETICVVAIVVGLDGQPLGRSDVAEFETTVEEGEPIPNQPYSFRLGGK